jgi:hypothetical protein
MDFEHAHPLALCFIAVLIWLVLSVPVLWPFSRERIKDRFPFILTVANYPLGLAVMDLPKALPGQFESLLGHSIYAHRFDTDWQWINRWEMAVAPILRYGMMIGAVWGLANLVRGRARIINTLAVAATILQL